MRIILKLNSNNKNNVLHIKLNLLNNNFKICQFKNNSNFTKDCNI